MVLTSTQVSCLRGKPDFQAVISFYASNGWATDWAKQAAFIADYGTWDNYMVHVGCAGGGGVGGISTTTLLLIAGVAVVAYMLMKKKI
jgi:hypothetical protein